MIIPRRAKVREVNSSSSNACYEQAGLFFFVANETSFPFLSKENKVGVGEEGSLREQLVCHSR